MNFLVFIPMLSASSLMAQAPTSSCQSAESAESARSADKSADTSAKSARSAEAFAPNLADSGRLFRGTFSADGRVLYFFKKVTPGKEDYRIYTSEKQGNAWAAPVRLDLGGEFSDLYPSVSPDGKRMAFVSYRPAPGDTMQERNGYLWYTERTGDGWGAPRFIGVANEFGSYHSGPVIEADYSIHFHRTSADWRRKWSLHTSWNGVNYETPVAGADEEVLGQWTGWQGGKYHIWGGTMPKPDLLLIEMSEKNESGRPKPPELWISRKQGSRWTKPVLAEGGVNTPLTENFFTPTPDGCSLLFVRNFSEFYVVGLDAVRGNL
jgi:hypothetical protein